MTKQSKILSEREIQPGSDTRGRKNEVQITKNISEFCKENNLDYFIKGTERCFYIKERRLQFDLVIKNKKTGKFMTFEIKRQGPKGNAHERGYKLFLPKVQEELRKNSLYKGSALIACSALAVEPRYQKEFEAFLEKDQVIYAKNKNVLLGRLQELVLPLLGE